MPSLTGAKPSRTVLFDKPRQIRFNWSSACRFEEVYGKSIPDAMQSNVGVTLMTKLAWAGMLHAEPSLTMREAERRIQCFIQNGGDVNQLGVELVSALAESGVLGKPKTEEPSEELPPAEGPEGNAPTE